MFVSLYCIDNIDWPETNTPRGLVASISTAGNDSPGFLPLSCPVKSCISLAENRILLSQPTHLAT